MVKELKGEIRTVHMRYFYTIEMPSKNCKKILKKRLLQLRRTFFRFNFLFVCMIFENDGNDPDAVDPTKTRKFCSNLKISTIFKKFQKKSLKEEDVSKKNSRLLELYLRYL